MRSALRSLRAFAGLAAAVARANLGSARPFKATVVLTERCDCRCEICGIWRKPKAPEPTPDDVARFLRGAPSVRWLNLTGGEIFLRDDVEAVCEAAVAAQPLLAVLDFPTTGQRTERIVAAVDRIARLGVPRFFVTVSVEGPPALHDRLRGREGAFERALTTYAALRGRRDVAAFLGLTLSDRNEGALEATFPALFELSLEHRDALLSPGDARVASLFASHFVEESKARADIRRSSAACPRASSRSRSRASCVRSCRAIARPTSRSSRSRLPGSRPTRAAST